MTVPSSRTWVVLALAAAFALALGPASRAADPSLYANYSANCTFAFVNDNGAAVSNIAPGTYQLVVFTPFAFSNGLAACETIQFHLTGPGLNFDTDLGSGDAEIEQHTVILQPGGTYTVQDDGRPAQTRRTFTVATSGSPTPVPSPGSSPTTPTSTTKGTPSKDPVGSKVLPFRGALAAAVSAKGKLSLLKAKQAVSTLKTGRYTIRVVDGSAKAGFSVQLVKKSPTTISTRPFTGSRSVTLSLARGQWVFFTPGGSKHFFVVTK